MKNAATYHAIGEMLGMRLSHKAVMKWTVDDYERSCRTLSSAYGTIMRVDGEFVLGKVRNIIAKRLMLAKAKVSWLQGNYDEARGMVRGTAFDDVTDFGRLGHYTPAYRHINPDGSQGGYVAYTAYVDDTVFLGEDVEVYDSALVLERATLTGHVRVCGNAVVAGYAELYGEITVTDNAVVAGQASLVGSNITVAGQAVVEGRGQAKGNVIEIYGKLRDNGFISSGVEITKDGEVCENFKVIVVLSTPGSIEIEVAKRNEATYKDDTGGKFTWTTEGKFIRGGLA